MDETENKKYRSAEILGKKVLMRLLEDGEEIGSHIKEITFANKLNVSRTPIRSAFAYLEEKGFLVKRPNQGYFLAKLPPEPVKKSLHQDDENSALTPMCYQIGQDYLRGLLAKNFTESELMSRYNQSRKMIQTLLLAMEQDGWLTRSLGYGWEFNDFISSPIAYEQSYRFRCLIEPEALLEPRFEVNQTQIHMLRMTQLDILNNPEKLVSAGKMFNAGVLFHETIVAMSGNVFLLDALKRINRLRRLIEYNVNAKRTIPKKECEEHLALLTLIENGRLREASNFLHQHLARAASEKALIAQKLFE